jgi:hypothetical protein
MNLTTYLNLVQRLRMTGGILPLLHTPSQRDGDNLSFMFITYTEGGSDDMHVWTACPAHENSGRNKQVILNKTVSLLWNGEEFSSENYGKQ